MRISDKICFFAYKNKYTNFVTIIDDSCNKNKRNYDMGQIAWISVFMFVVLPIDINDNRRHIHIFYKGKRDQECAAKFWIESNGKKCIEIAYSTLSSKENERIMKAIDNNWEFH